MIATGGVVRLSLILGFVFVGGLIAYGAIRGASSAAERHDPMANGGADRRAPRFFGAAAAFGHGDASRKDVDPFAPPGLPAGVRIDPETGWMTGLPALGKDGATWLTWADLAEGDYEDGVDDLPARIAALEGKRVVVAGFFKAIYEVQDIRTFLLVGSHLACCFGTFPGPEGVIEVTLGKDQPSARRLVEPVLVTGTLRFRVLYDSYRGRRRVALVFQIVDAKLELLASDSGG